MKMLYVSHYLEEDSKSIVDYRICHNLLSHPYHTRGHNTWKHPLKTIISTSLRSSLPCQNDELLWTILQTWCLQSVYFYSYQCLWMSPCDQAPNCHENYQDFEHRRIPKISIQLLGYGISLFAVTLSSLYTVTCDVKWNTTLNCGASLSSAV